MASSAVPLKEGEDDLRQQVSQWLRKQGYPLEMRVARVFQEEEFRVIQSDFYEDPEAGQTREIDVVAIKQSEMHGILFRISIVIECKFSKDKPWVLFQSLGTRLAPPARVAQRIASRFGEKLLYAIAQQPSAQGLSVFDIPELPCYGLTQAFNSGQDLCFSATTSVAKAALALTMKADKHSTPRRPSGLCEIAIPVIVIDGRLFAAQLNKISEVEVSEVRESTLLWRNPVAKMPHTIIKVLTMPSLEPFVASASDSIRRFFHLCEFDYRGVIEQINEESDRPPMTII